MGSRAKMVVGMVAMAVVGVVAGAAAFACTVLPAVNISQPYGAAGTAVSLTGSSWVAEKGPVDVRWNSLNGPVLAEVTPDASGVIGPVTIQVPASSEPGYYALIGTRAQNPNQSESARAVFQVTGANGAVARPPQVALPGGAPVSSPSGLSVGLIGLLAATGVAGLGLFTFGAATFARSRRVRAPVRQTSRR